MKELKQQIQHITFLEGIDRLLHEIEELDSIPSPTLIGIAGGYASGKSHISSVLAEKLDLSVLHMDDY